MGGAKMLVIDLPDTLLTAQQSDYFENLCAFTTIPGSYLTPLELSLENKQILAVTQLPVTPSILDGPRVNAAKAMELLHGILEKLSLAEQHGLRLGCYSPDSIFVAERAISCNSLTAVANGFFGEATTDCAQVACSVIYATTGLAVNPNNLDGFWRAEINLENPILRQLLDDLLTCSTASALASLRQISDASSQSPAANASPVPTTSPAGVQSGQNATSPISLGKPSTSPTLTPPPQAVPSPSRSTPSAPPSTSSFATSDLSQKRRGAFLLLAVVAIACFGIVSVSLQQDAGSPPVRHEAVTDKPPSDSSQLQQTPPLPTTKDTYNDPGPQQEISGLSRDRAVGIVSQWLSKKAVVFAPPYDIESVGSLVTGALWQDLAKEDGPVNWLKNNNSYYRYSSTSVRDILGYQSQEGMPALTLRIYEDRTLYTPNGIDPRQSGITDATFTYLFAVENGIWMISDYRKN